MSKEGQKKVDGSNIMQPKIIKKKGYDSWQNIMEIMKYISSTPHPRNLAGADI